MSTASQLPPTATLSQQAERRLRNPLRRGVFRDIDAARAQFGLLSVADHQGQARIYWLIDLNTQIIEDARFLAFGDRASHPIADCWSELVRGRSVEEACSLELDDIEAALRDDPESPAFGEAELYPLAFITDLQQRALQALPSVKLLPKPVEVERYQRKREADWDDADKAWLPLSLMKKIMQAQQVIGTGLAERLGRSDVDWSVEGLHDDFRVVVAFGKKDGYAPPADERPTVLAFMQEAARSIHPAIVVEEQESQV